VVRVEETTVLDGATARPASGPLKVTLDKTGSAHLCRNQGLAMGGAGSARTCQWPFHC